MREVVGKPYNFSDISETGKIVTILYFTDK